MAKAPAINPGHTQALPIKFLFGKVQSGEFALPEFQRPKVWDWQQERELLISLALNVPIGSFLLWEYNHGNIAHRDSIPHKFDYTSFTPISKPWSGVKFLVIDGQQRLGYLASILALIGTSTNEGRVVASFKIVGTRESVDFEKFNEDIHWDVTTNKIKDPAKLAFVDELADTGNNAVIPALDSNYQNLANDFRTNFSTREVSVYTLPITEKRYKALFVYQRVNSSGKKLVDEDYAEATLGYLYPDLSKKIKDFIDTMKSSIPGLENKLSRNLFVKCMLDEIFDSPLISDAKNLGLDLFNPRIITTKEVRRKCKVVTPEVSTTLTDTIVKQAFEDVKTSFNELKKMFKGDWHLTNGKYLLTNEILFGSAYIRKVKSVKTGGKAAKLDAKMRGKLSKWMILSMVKKPTSGGSTQNMAREACRAMRGSNPWNDISTALTNSDGIKLKPVLVEDDLGVLDDQKECKLGSSSMYFALLRYHNIKNKCEDIVDNTNLSDPELHLDHFYASSKMKKRVLKKGPVGYFDHLWDHAANKIWLNGGTNMWKKAKWPTNIAHGDFSKGSIKKKKKNKKISKNLNLQALPDKGIKKQKRFIFDDSIPTHVVSKYIKFLEFRRKKLVNILNRTLNDMETNGI